MSSQVDMRGFSYALEPLLRKQHWEMEATQARLARLQKTIGEAVESGRQWEILLAERSEQLKAALSGRFDPLAHGQALAYIAGIHRSIEDNRKKLDGLESEKRALVDVYARQTAKLEMIEQHKTACMHEYIAAEQNRQSSELDKDWLARRSLRDRHADHPASQYASGDAR